MLCVCECERARMCVCVCVNALGDTFIYPDEESHEISQTA